jgi:hypothetical protein
MNFKSTIRCAALLAIMIVLVPIHGFARVVLVSVLGAGFFVSGMLYQEDLEHNRD